METIATKIARFLALNTGYGDGSGYGSGYGDGDGSGSGDGDGSGSGYGDGSGYGYGDGSGYGSGSGSGSGDGSGYGSGSGDGVKEFKHQTVYMIDGVQTLIYSVHVNYAKGATLSDDLTLNPCYIARHGDYFAHGDNLHDALVAAMEKFGENRPLEERIADFVHSHLLGKKYPMDNLYKWHHILTGSCDFGRRKFCEKHGITEGDSFTPEEFIELTKNAYGGGVIQQLAEAYNK